MKEIKLVCWTGDNLVEVIETIGLHLSAKKWTWDEYEHVVETEGLKIFTPNGAVIADIGNWILKNEHDECFVCIKNGNIMKCAI